MPSQQLEALNKELHPHAEQLAREIVNDFAANLLLQSKLVASQQRAEVVLRVHIEEALNIISREQKKGWSRELLIVIGAALFGAFIPGFITELSAGRQQLTVIYTALGLLGMFLVFLGLRR